MSDTNKKVLIVDDDNFLLDMYSMKFKKGNFEVDTAPGADIALEKIEGGYVPDILLLDIVMPKMDGIEFLTTVRQKKLLQNTVIVVLSNQGQPSDIKRAEELGVNGYIVKATTIPSEVVSEVTRIFNDHELRTRA